MRTTHWLMLILVGLDMFRIRFLLNKIGPTVTQTRVRFLTRDRAPLEFEVGVNSKKKRIDPARGTS